MDIFPPGTTMDAVLKALSMRPAATPPMSILPTTPPPVAPVADPFGTRVQGKDQSRVPHGFAYQFNP